MGVSAAERGMKCRFRLADVVCPEQRDALMQVTANLEVSGEIAYCSDQSNEANGFAILDVEGIHSPLIVPIDRLQPVAEAAPGEENR